MRVSAPPEPPVDPSWPSSPAAPPPITDPASTPPASTVPTGETGAPPAGPAWDIGATALYVNLGDSLAAGYDAAGEYGYAELLHANKDLDAPAYAGHDLASLSDADLIGITESGANSSAILDNLLGADLPPADGPVVVTISAGGNDFNDAIEVMLAEPLTRIVAAQLRANLAAMIDELRAEYDEVHIYVLNVQDPTDGTGAIPESYDSDLCGVIQAVPPLLAQIGVSNLQILNDEIAAEAAEQGVELVDYHGFFLGHGLTSSDGWMSGDCAHPTTLGHHHLRTLIWSQWTGEWW